MDCGICDASDDTMKITTGIAARKGRIAARQSGSGKDTDNDEYLGCCNRTGISGKRGRCCLRLHTAEEKGLLL